MWVARPPMSSTCPSCPHYRTAPVRGQEGLFVQSSQQRGDYQVLEGRTSCSTSESSPGSPYLLASLGFLKSLCHTITSNFIAFMGRRVLSPAPKTFYVPWALPPRPPSLFLSFPASNLSNCFPVALPAHLHPQTHTSAILPCPAPEKVEQGGPGVPPGPPV